MQPKGNLQRNCKLSTFVNADLLNNFFTSDTEQRLLTELRKKVIRRRKAQHFVVQVHRPGLQCDYRLE